MASDPRRGVSDPETEAVVAARSALATRSITNISVEIQLVATSFLSQVLTNTLSTRNILSLVTAASHLSQLKQPRLHHTTSTVHCSTPLRTRTHGHSCLSLLCVAAAVPSRPAYTLG
eukprot:3273834-Pleurochrysis_carterae.AAC.1